MLNSQEVQNVLGLLTIIAMLAAYVTHVIHSIAEEAWVILVIGALFFPVGIIHGAAVWFGIF
ncbi:hypothetical protein [Thioalkalivibrio sp. ALE23]|uniref:hypothetical protein n=1 Tax=Thioalkalivibrio sp. ALE23 TaxID=1265495 RepID=UPI00037FDAB8|nr:hypothetical protein [Thioalkalivibrio sp. ALE23]